ncbi:MAG TPA: HypC/HybG/HupF family hydrogenase formation chaperone [Acidimicrobiia bacterium]
MRALGLLEDLPSGLRGGTGLPGRCRPVYSEILPGLCQVRERPGTPRARPAKFKTADREAEFVGGETRRYSALTENSPDVSKSHNASRFDPSSRGRTPHGRTTADPSRREAGLARTAPARQRWRRPLTVVAPALHNELRERSAAALALNEEGLSMCLGVPGRVVEVNGLLATVDFWGVRRDVRLDIVDEPVQAGDYILNHVGFAIRKIPSEEIAETLALYEQLLEEAESDMMAADVRGEIEATADPQRVRKRDA